MKSEYDFGGIFGEASKNHDKIPTTNLRSDEMHPPNPLQGKFFH